jgi:hypothetical protein
MLGQVAAKTPINIRLSQDTLELLEQVSETEGTLFWQRDRTWLIEYAIGQTYSDFVTAEKENGSPPR